MKRISSAWVIALVLTLAVLGTTGATALRQAADHRTLEAHLAQSHAVVADLDRIEHDYVTGYDILVFVDDTGQVWDVPHNPVMPVPETNKVYILSVSFGTVDDYTVSADLTAARLADIQHLLQLISGN